MLIYVTITHTPTTPPTFPTPHIPPLPLKPPIIHTTPTPLNNTYTYANLSNHHIYTPYHHYPIIHTTPTSPIIHTTLHPLYRPTPSTSLHPNTNTYTHGNLCHHHPYTPYTHYTPYTTYSPTPTTPLHTFQWTRQWYQNNKLLLWKLERNIHFKRRKICGTTIIRSNG